MRSELELTTRERARLYATVWYRATRDAHREGGAFWAAVVALVTPLFLRGNGLALAQLTDGFDPAGED
jgi:hypothetical protein